MKAYWYASTLLLFIGVLAGFGAVTPTSAVVANLAPVWSFPTDTFFADEDIVIDLNTAFFDPDGDRMRFDAITSQGVSMNITDKKLRIKASRNGTVVVIAHDGKTTSAKRLYVKKPAPPVIAR